MTDATRGQPKRGALRTLASPAALAAAFLSLRCGKLLGAEDYATAPTSDGTGSALDAAPPTDAGHGGDAAPQCPVAPDTPWLETSGSTPLYDATCVACLKDKCKAQFDVCQAKPACAAFFDSVKHCGDPRCWMEVVRNYDFNFDLMPSNQYKVSGQSLDGCAITNCGKECRVGSNFDCIGRTFWDETHAGGAMTFSVRTGVFAPIAGATTRACLTDHCAQAASDWVTTGADGKATLEVDGGTPGFTGYFTAVPPPDSEPPRLAFDLKRNYPFWHGEQILFFDLYSPKQLDTLLADKAGQAYDPSRAYGMLRVYDCNHFAVGDAEVEVRSLKGAPVVLPPAATAEYLIGQYFVGGLDASCPAVLSVKEPKSGRAIAKLAFEIAPSRGFSYYVVPK